MFWGSSTVLPLILFLIFLTNSGVIPSLEHRWRQRRPYDLLSHELINHMAGTMSPVFSNWIDTRLMLYLMKSLKQSIVSLLRSVSSQVPFSSISAVGLGWSSRILLWLSFRLDSSLLSLITLRNLRQQAGVSYDQLRSRSFRYSDSCKNWITLSNEFSFWLALTRARVCSWESVSSSISISLQMWELFIWQSMSLISCRWLGRRFSKRGRKLIILHSLN